MTDRANLPLQRACRWEKERAREIFLTQPLDGRVRDWSWEQTLAEARRVANWLAAQNWPPGSRVAIMAKNSAWWILSDLAIWMAGHVSVPIYPSLAGSSVRQIIEHSGSIACFVGRVDDYAAMKSGLPPDIACIGLPAAAANEFLQWDAIVASTEPLRGEPVRNAEELATIIYTSGTTGRPKGCELTHGNFLFDIASTTEGLHEFFGMYVRYATHVGAYRYAAPGDLRRWRLSFRPARRDCRRLVRLMRRS